MSEPGETPWWRRRWATVGEAVGLAALVVAALGYWDAHRERGAERAERAAAVRQEAARRALVLTAVVQDDGARLALSPLRPGQAIQSQRYLFPRAVSPQVMEVSAAQPQIDRAWFEAGLKAALQAAAQARGGKLEEGEGALPVAVVTSYIEDGEARTDASLYRIGFRLGPAGLFGGRNLVAGPVAAATRAGRRSAGCGGRKLAGDGGAAAGPRGRLTPPRGLRGSGQEPVERFDADHDGDARHQEGEQGQADHEAAPGAVVERRKAARVRLSHPTVMPPRSGELRAFASHN